LWKKCDLKLIVAVDAVYSQHACSWFVQGKYPVKEYRASAWADFIVRQNLGNINEVPETENSASGTPYHEGERCVGVL
jgi:hypothetical protein